MAEIGSRRGAAPSMTPVLMIVAFLAMAGFLYWLSISAEGTQVEVVEGQGEDTAEVDTGPPAEELTMDIFRGDPEAYLGQRVRITDATVSSLLGQSGRLFWLQPDDNPYLVHRDSTVATGTDVNAGMRGTVSGVVHEMADSVLDAWEEAGAFTAESDRFVAEFATTYIEADRMRLRAAQGGGGQGGGQGGGGSGG